MNGTGQREPGCRLEGRHFGDQSILPVQKRRVLHFYFRYLQFTSPSTLGLGVVIDDEASKKFSIPQRHRLFRVTHVELHACWHESHEVYESQDTQTDGEIVLADSYFHRNYSFLLSVKWVARE